jgi:hypothetical protein
MIATFKDLHTIPKRSKKSPCFSCIVCLDGEPAFEATGAGDGSPVEFSTLKGMAEKFQAFREECETHGADFKTFFNAALEKELARREMLHLMKAYAVFVRASNVCFIELHNRESLANTRKYLKAKYPKAILLNDMDEAAALDLYRRHPKKW